MRKKLIDKSKCVGCKNCELACISVHSNGRNPFDLNPDSGAERARNKVEISNDGTLFPEFCRHCNEPACVEACMSGALTKGEDGLVTCDHDICIGCFMCVMSCPYGMARPSVSTDGKMIKCDGCRGRSSMACVDACPQRCIKQIESDDKTGGHIVYA